MLAKVNFIAVKSKKKNRGSSNNRENIINHSKGKAGSIGSAFKSDDSRANKGLSIVNVLSTQGDSSSNGTHFGDRKHSTATKMKSSSMSSGSNERNTMKKIKKGSSEPKIQPKMKEPNLKIDEKKKPEFYQRMDLKSGKTRNLCHQNNNHHRHNKLYSSGEREPEEGAANYLAKTTEKLKIDKRHVKDILSKSRAKAANINPANIKSSSGKLKRSRGRSNKSGPTSNRNSSNEAQVGTMKIKKNPHQTIKFNKKKIQFARCYSQNQKKIRNLSNNPKIIHSKKSDDSGNTKDDGNDENSSNGKKGNKVEMPTNWKVKGASIEKIAALASISKYNNTGNFTSDDFKG